MNIVIREYTASDVKDAIVIWNQVVEDGVAFPQEENLTEESGDAFFKEQRYTGIAQLLLPIPMRFICMSGLALRSWE